MKAFLIFFLSLLILLTLPLEALGEREACMKNKEGSDKTKALQLKLIAIASILAAGATGVLIPILGRCISALRPEKDIFFIIKAFAAGVILATGLIHILPDAFERLTSQCLEKEPWHTFPFAGFVAMCSAMGTMMVDSCATSYYKRSHFSKALPVDDGSEEGDGERGGQHANHVHMHTHGAHGHAHGELAPPAPAETGLAERIRHRVISQVSY